jgi:hypothetical protein
VTGGAGSIDEPAEPWGAAAGDLVRAAAMGETAAWDDCSAATADSCAPSAGTTAERRGRRGRPPADLAPAARAAGHPARSRPGRWLGRHNLAGVRALLSSAAPACNSRHRTASRPPRVKSCRSRDRSSARADEASGRRGCRRYLPGAAPGGRGTVDHRRGSLYARSTMAETCGRPFVCFGRGQPAAGRHAASRPARRPGASDQRGLTAPQAERSTSPW